MHSGRGVRRRFKRLAESFEIDPECLPALLPTLLLQPLVENAIRYAIMPNPGGGQLILRAQRVADRARIEIIDVIKFIEPAPMGRPVAGAGTGIENCRERMQLLLGAGRQLGRGAYEYRHPGAVGFSIFCDSAQTVTALRTLIADDEPMARLRLRRLLQNQPGLVIVAESGNGLKVARDIERHRPEVVFLDIQMPGLDGFEALALSPGYVPAAVVFVTAHSQFAVRAFSIHATDYLLKPLDPDRLTECVARIRDNLRTGQVGKYSAHLLVSHGNRRLRIDVMDIERLAASGNYVEVFTARRSYLLRDTLQRVAGRLDSTQFARIHRSHIVRVSAIHDIETLRDGSCVIRLRSGAILKGSRSAGRLALGILRGQKLRDEEPE